MPCRGIHQTIYLGERIIIFWTCLVKVCEVNAHPLFPIWFFDEDDIGQPIRVFALPNESCIQQFFHFFFGGLDSLSPLMSQLLLHRFVAWFYVKFVAHNTCWYARHFFRGKSEDVTEFNDVSYYLLLDCTWKVFSDFDLLPLEYLYLLVSFH